MLSLFRDDLLKLSETTSPPKLFPYDYMTLYQKKWIPDPRACLADCENDPGLISDRSRGNHTLLDILL